MEKRIFLILVSLLLFSTLFSVASAEIIFNQPVNEVYNIGDSIKITVVIKAATVIQNQFHMDLICDGKYLSNVVTNGVSLEPGEEQQIDANVVLSKNVIGSMMGTCKLKGILGGEYKITEEFEVSDLIIIQSKVEQIEFNPGESMVVKGDAFKENSEDVNGFVNLKIVTGNGTGIEQLGTVNNGYFSVNVSLPKNLAAGSYLVSLDVYEINQEGEQTNKGFMNYNINVKQVPTNLEIVFENSDIEPGTKLKTKTILHDQTGEPISAISIITIKKSKNEILQQTEVSTNEFIEVEIPYNEPPANWTIVGVSSMLQGEGYIIIKEKKEISVELMNETILISNKGNVPYNESVLLKIGNNSINIDVYLEVDESKQYKLSAPNGQYRVEVISGGKSRLDENILLTGKTVDVKESGFSKINFINLLVWIFAILVIGAVSFLIYKKGRRGFFGRFKKKHKLANINSEPQIKMKDFPITDAVNKAVLLLSIKGEKHEAGIVCLRIKNLSEIKKEGIKDTMRKIDALIESKKVFVYENQESLFFIFSPIKTKTFRNEKAAIQLAQELKEILIAHNKIFKYKMDFGISINTGYIVSRINHKKELEFMGMGNIIAGSRKIANLASSDIFLSKEVKEKAGSMIKTDDKVIDGVKVYTIREMREREQYKTFINNFLRSQERDKEEKKKREEKRKELEEKKGE